MMSADLRVQTAKLPYGCVLIVEDDVNTAECLQEVLGLWGCAAVVAHTGADALRIAKALRPDLVLCDLQLPDMLGSSIATALRRSARTARARLIALSGYSD